MRPLSCRGAALAALVLALAGLSSACSAPFRTVITLKRQDLQRRIEPKFPVQQDAGVGRVVLYDPVVLLHPGEDRVGLNLSVRVEVLGLEHTGRAEVKGELQYQSPDGQIYLVRPEITALRVDGLPADLLSPITSTATSLLREQLPKIPVHRLKSAKEQAAKPFVKSVRVRDGAVRVELGL